jgi:hypothetical protein
MRLTGRTRYRLGWFGKVILQVEEACITAGPGRPQPGRDFVRYSWRDARLTDVVHADAPSEREHVKGCDGCWCGSWHPMTVAFGEQNHVPAPKR